MRAASETCTIIPLMLEILSKNGFDVPAIDLVTNRRANE